MRIILIAFTLFIFLGQTSFAEVYRWIDEKGYVHFTDDVTQVPEKYRKEAERIGGENDDKTEGELAPTKKEEVYRDRLGMNGADWKAKIEEWRKKLYLLQEKLEALRSKYNELTGKFNDSRSSAERAGIRKERELVKNEMDQYRIQIGEAKDMLEKKIPEEAELYKAKPEWLKQ